MLKLYSLIHMMMMMMMVMSKYLLSGLTQGIGGRDTWVTSPVLLISL